MDGRELKYLLAKLWGVQHPGYRSCLDPRDQFCLQDDM